MTSPKQRQRRIKLTQRQLTLAKIARREAMAALADTVKEETRSAALAQRSRNLMAEYAARQVTPTGGSLRESAAFSRGLQEISEQAGQARDDASEQAAWQVQTLAAAETRQARFEEKLSHAKQIDAVMRANRELAYSSGMARKLQSTSDIARDASTDLSEES